MADVALSSVEQVLTYLHEMSRLQATNPVDMNVTHGSSSHLPGFSPFLLETLDKSTKKID